MSAAGADSPQISERRVRREARGIVDELDRRIDTLQTTLGCVALLSPLLFFPVFWKLQEIVWWKSALFAFGSGVAVLIVGVVVSIYVESRLTGKALRRFELRFPEGSPHRPLAEALLADVEPRTEGVTEFLAQIVTPGEAHVTHAPAAMPVAPRPAAGETPKSAPAPALAEAAIPLELPGMPGREKA